MRKAKVWDARQLPAYLTVAQYGELMGICPKTVRRMCQRGELPAHKEGPRLWRIDKNAALEQRQEAMEICQRNARKAPKNKKPAGAGHRRSRQRQGAERGRVPPADGAHQGGCPARCPEDDAGRSEALGRGEPGEHPAEAGDGGSQLYGAGLAGRPAGGRHQHALQDRERDAGRSEPPDGGDG